MELLKSEKTLFQLMAWDKKGNKPLAYVIDNENETKFEIIQLLDKHNQVAFRDKITKSFRVLWYINKMKAISTDFEHLSNVLSSELTDENHSKNLVAAKELQIEANRLALNFVCQSRFLIDQLQHKYLSGNKVFKSFLNNVFDSNVEYRFCYKLRNLFQHLSFDPIEVDFDYDYDPVTNRLIEMHTRFEFNLANIKKCDDFYRRGKWSKHFNKEITESAAISCLDYFTIFNQLVQSVISKGVVMLFETEPVRECFDLYREDLIDDGSIELLSTRVIENEIIHVERSGIDIKDMKLIMDSIDNLMA